MKARQCVEFISVDLTSGAELAAPMEKAMTSLVEKATVGPRAGESHDGWEAQWRGRKTCCRAWAWWRCWPAERRHDGEGGTVECVVTEAEWWSAVTVLR
jgi:hypothetical protein